MNDIRVITNSSPLFWSEPPISYFAYSFGQIPVPIFFRRVEERESARRTLGEIGRLEANWDGHGSLAVTKEAINHASRFLSILENWTPTLISPEITPTSSGTIALEWETERGEAYLEIGKTRFSFFARVQSQVRTLEEGLAAEIDRSLPELIENCLFPTWTSSAVLSLFPPEAWQAFEVNYLDPIGNALLSMQPPTITINKDFGQTSLCWTVEGSFSDPVAYYSPEDVPVSVYSESAKITRIALAA